MVPGVLALLSTIYRRLQQDGQTSICENKEGMHWQLGMGRQRTASIGRIQDKTHHGTSTGLLRPRRANHNRKRSLKISLLWYTMTIIPGWKMETSGVLIQDNVGRRIQLQHT